MDATSRQIRLILKKNPKHCLKLGPWFCCNSNNGTSCFCVCSRIEDTISAMVLYTHVYKWFPQRSLYCIYIYRFVLMKFCPINFCVHLSKYLRTVFNIRFYKVEQWSFCAITRGNFYRSENAFFFDNLTKAIREISPLKRQWVQ